MKEVFVKSKNTIFTAGGSGPDVRLVTHRVPFYPDLFPREAKSLDSFPLAAVEALTWCPVIWAPATEDTGGGARYVYIQVDTLWNGIFHWRYRREDRIINGT